MAIRSASEEYNSLPIETKRLGSIMESRMRMNQLIMEKGRLKKRYKQSMEEVDDHIRNLKKRIFELEEDRRVSDG